MDSALGCVEELDHSFGRDGESSECCNYRLGRERSDMAKRYLDSDLNMIVRVGRSSRQNVAVIRKLLPHEFVELGRENAITIDTDAVRRRIGIHQLPMLARDIQVVEGPQKFWNVSLRGMAGDVRSFPDRKRKAALFFTSAALKLVDGKADRKDIFFSDVSVSLGEFVGEHVQTASQRRGL